ncbi:3398_t:CDS:2 [Dentiscutata erythropus]|uniref:3398_t:CDS:1 n=1 Tax=Dentiscutata erythropus TaxID=1348616 RepID=A0A9N8VL05_9GLOM|nr:3398_t:CDS:2 [Dentiscutata erythropus]
MHIKCLKLTYLNLSTKIKGIICLYLYVGFLILPVHLVLPSKNSSSCSI